jgi:hypothetical protein
MIQTYVFWNVHEPVQGQVDALLIFIWTPVKAPEKYPVSETPSTKMCKWYHFTSTTSREDMILSGSSRKFKLKAST